VRRAGSSHCILKLLRKTALNKRIKTRENYKEYWQAFGIPYVFYKTYKNTNCNKFYVKNLHESQKLIHSAPQRHKENTQNMDKISFTPLNEVCYSLHPKPQLLHGNVWKSATSDFTQIGQEIWNALKKSIYSLKYDCHWADFHENSCSVNIFC
jgi:hypothetical protein